MAGYFYVCSLDESGKVRRINLAANPIRGGNYEEMGWTPHAPPADNLWNSSPFSDGQQIVMRKYGLTADTVTVKIQGANPDIAIRMTQEIRRLLTKAVDYFISDWATEPVWLEVLNDGETNPRKAYVYDFQMPDDDDPFQMPFGGVCPSVLPEVNITILHSWWMNTLTGECVKISGLRESEGVDDYSARIFGSAGDAEVNLAAGTIDDTEVYLRLGDPGSTPRQVGLMFKLGTLPQGATIVRAYVRFTAYQSLGGEDVNLVIRGEDTDIVSTFSTYADFVGRPRTTANELWHGLEAWTIGNTYDSVDFTDVLQEIIDRPGWPSYGDVVIFFEDDGSTDAAYRVATSWDKDEGPGSPEIYIEFFVGALEFGRDETCLDEVYVGNRNNYAQLTHIWYYDASLGAFSANLVGAALPFALLPATPAANDYIIFMIDDFAANAYGPFGSLIFDILAAQTGITDTEWEYYNGAWSFLRVVDNTASGGVAFSKTGVNGVHWRQPSDWISVTINGITGKAVGLRVVAAGGGATAPTQQNRNIYTAIWNYIDIDNENIGGDVPAMAEIKMYCNSIISTLSTLPGPASVIMGLRSISRGYDFVSMINFSDVQNIAGIGVVNGLPAVFADDMQSSTGRVIDYPPAVSGSFLNIAQIQFSTLSGQWAGRYRAFLRLKQTGGTAGDFDVYLTVNLGAHESYRTSMQTTASVDLHTLDMGTVIINQPLHTSWGVMILSLWARANNLGSDLFLYDLILIPADEWIGEYNGIMEGNDTVVRFGGTNYLDVDPITQVKFHNPAFLRVTSTGVDVVQWNSRGISFPILQSNKDQRLHFFFRDRISPPSTEPYMGKPEITVQPMINAIQRYFSGRGDR